MEQDNEDVVYLHAWDASPFEPTYTVHKLPLEGDGLLWRKKVTAKKGEIDE